MWNTSLAITSADFSSIGGIIGTVLLIVIALGVVFRVVVVLMRRKRKGIQREVLGPIFKSGGVQSELYGWKASEAGDMRPATHQSGLDPRKPKRD